MTHGTPYEQTDDFSQTADRTDADISSLEDDAAIGNRRETSTATPTNGRPDGRVVQDVLSLPTAVHPDPRASVYSSLDIARGTIRAE
ncbi:MULTISPECIES: hypothetical protein [Haloferax]|uniref:Uncharacterized protein n=2 Tax=Haloferax TaxID=2251 RepID=A0A6G1Z6H3_9EURY|nr:MULTISPECIES: hypothetical protein [Haloferax]KAB1189167.1 hypothetical protein Hfx1149_14425 [Haloferax sp. CBA1149]MRW81904.1 hypothetical protein [Haloferax marinisediminis]